MSAAPSRAGAGVFLVNAHERIALGTPAEAAVPAEVGRWGARRVFMVSTGSLASLERGPLQRIERALGSAHAGTFAGIRSRSPLEDVVAGANAARAAGADLMVAVGGGSAIDAAKAMLLSNVNPRPISGVADVKEILALAW